MKKKALVIWMNGERVGAWDPSRDAFLYYDVWCKGEYARSLSLSLPIVPGNKAHRGEAVRNYFENLLPDSDVIRRRLVSKFGAKSTDAADLLAVVGKDCVGAIQILPPDMPRPPVEGIEGVAVSNADIARILRNTTSNQQMNINDDDEGLRLSIAGAQEKTALLYFDGQWYLPKNATPTTHILKLPLGLVGNIKADMTTSVENEWLCSRIAYHYGIPVAQCEPLTFSDEIGTVKVLSVERFDRLYDAGPGMIVRLPQEDMCQALGISPLHKYEADGGPDARSVMDLLKLSDNHDEDCRNFFKTLIVFWLLAATDGHGKNFSIFLRPGGRYAMTPLYDILSAHPLIGSGANSIPKQKVKLAMAVRSATSKHYLAFKIVTRHWLEFGEQLGLPLFEVLSILSEVHQATPSVIAKVAAELPDDFPQNVSEPIFSGMTTMNTKLRDIDSVT